MILAEKSPAWYVKIYLEGRNIRNAGMDLGKEIAEAIELDQETGDPMKDFVIAQLPKFELRDPIIDIELPITGKEVIPIRFRPDSIRNNHTAFKEYKTGSGKWTQKKVNESVQLPFYATCIYIEDRLIPEAELIWAPTEKVVDPTGAARFELTGDIHRFGRTFSYAEVLAMMVRMRRAWKKIEEITNGEIPL